MARLSLVYHEGYDLHFGAHVFPSQKYRLIYRHLLDSGLVGPDDFSTPEPASREQLRLVHEEAWIRKLETGTLTYQEIRQLEVPYSHQMVRGFFLAAGGTLLAGRLALAHGAAMNVGGGFHHAFPDHGEGFCGINDVAVAARVLLAEGAIERVLIADCDVHHGNGTAAIFAGDARVFTLSIHHFNNYPTEKPPSTVDLHLADGTSDEEYLRILRPAYEAALVDFKPELVFFVAGSDPYVDDKLGGLSLSREGLYQRDRLIFDLAFRRHIPVVATLAGGYANNLADTVELHAQTARAAIDSLSEWARHW
jgi:acetoin utilization deacetylase AcuC-like enzyme